MIANVNCRNFKCINNKKGGCCLNNIVLEPQGTLVKQVRCIEAEEKPTVEPEQEKGGNK